MAGRIENAAAVVSSSCEGPDPWRTVCMLPTFGDDGDVTKSLDGSSYSPSDSATSLQNKPKVITRTNRMPNLLRARIGLEVSLLASTKFAPSFV